MKRTHAGIFCVMLVLVTAICTAAFAHPGGLDSSGGHRDNKNRSGLGSYHYHCGDWPPHLHGPSGLCPYSAKYREYKAMVDELKAFADKAAPAGKGQTAAGTLDEGDVARMEELLSHEWMPFNLTPELLRAETTRFAKTNVKGANVRQRQSTDAQRVCTVSVAGTPVLVKEDMGKGWVRVLVHEDGKNHTGFMKADLLEDMDKPAYLAALCAIIE